MSQDVKDKTNELCNDLRGLLFVVICFAQQYQGDDVLERLAAVHQLVMDAYCELS